MSSEDINPEELEFSPTPIEGLEVAPIKGNPFKEAGTLAVKFAAGKRYLNPLHIHTYQYEAAIWKGQFTHFIPDIDEDDKNLEIVNVGGSFCIPAGQHHQDINPSPTECVIVYMYIHGPFDIFPVEEKKKTEP